MYVWSGSTWVQIATTSVYTAPTLGSQTIASGTTYTNIAGLTLTDPTVSGTLTVGLGGKITQTSASHVIVEGLRLPTGYTLEFEGATNDAFETTFGVIDPTADRTINLPNTSGTVITTGNSSEALPSQTSNNGKYLTTDGSTASWAAAVTSVTSANTTRISIGGTTSVPTVDLVTTAVTPATYTLSTITVDAYGRITSASTGTARGETFNPLLLMGA
jgi:hypothetical protein